MSAPAVRLTDVSVAYPNGTVALRVGDLVIDRGERVALVGASGAGKSTLLNLLSGRAVLDGAAVSGHVEVLGLPTSKLRGRSRRRHARRIGSIRQDLDLIGPLRVIHNLNAGRLGHWSTLRALWSLRRPLDRELGAELLAAVGLDASLLDDRVEELSGGQRQRVALARVLRQQPEVLLADEPVSSLDPASSAKILELIAATTDGSTGSGWTAVVSLHQPEFARRFADRAIGIQQGRVAFDVAIDDLTDDLLDQIYSRP